MAWVLALVVDKFHDQHVDVSGGLGVPNDRSEDVVVAECFGASAFAVRYRNHLGEHVGFMGLILILFIVKTIGSAKMLKSRRAKNRSRLCRPLSLVVHKLARAPSGEPRNHHHLMSVSLMRCAIRVL